MERLKPTMEQLLAAARLAALEGSMGDAWAAMSDMVKPAEHAFPDWTQEEVDGAQLLADAWNRYINEDGRDQ